MGKFFVRLALLILEGLNLVELSLQLFHQDKLLFWQDVLELDSACDEAVEIALIKLEQAKHIPLKKSCNPARLQLDELLFKNLSHQDKVILTAIDCVLSLVER